MNPLGIDFSTLPSLPLASRSGLPTCPAVYFVMEGDRILYIGRTGNLQQRWSSHHRWQQLKGIESVRLAWLECTQPELLSTIEEALIEQFCPPLNGSPAPPTKLPRVGTYISPQLKTDLEKLAKKEQRTLSNFIAVALQRVIDEAKQKGEID